MNAFGISGLLTGIISSILAIFTYFKGKTHRSNRMFAIACLAVASWGFGGFFISTAKDEPTALLYWRLTHIGVILIPVFFLHFVYLFLEIQNRLRLTLIYLIGAFFLIADLSDLLYQNNIFIKEVKEIFKGLFWDVHYSPNLYWLFTFLWFGIVFYGHYELFKAYKKASGLKRNQIKYFFLATAVGFSGGSTCFLPCFGINLYPILNFTVPLYPLIVSYAIIRYRVMDIRIVIGKGAIYFLSYLTVLIFGVGTNFLNLKLNEPIPNLLLISFTLILSIPLYQIVLPYFEKIASSYFYYTFYSLQKTLSELRPKLDQIIDLNLLTKTIIESLSRSLNIEKAGIIVKERENVLIPFVLLGIKEKEIFSLITHNQNFILDFLRKIKKPLVKEEIPLFIKDTEEKNALKEKILLSHSKNIMEKLGIAILLPLLFKEELIGIIVLGNKSSGEAYSAEELDLLTSFSSQISVVLNNALYYEEIKRQKNELEKWLKISIGRELKMMELKKKIKELEEKLEHYQDIIKNKRN